MKRTPFTSGLQAAFVAALTLLTPTIDARRIRGSSSSSATLMKRPEGTVSAEGIAAKPELQHFIGFNTAEEVQRYEKNPQFRRDVHNQLGLAPGLKATAGLASEIESSRFQIPEEDAPETNLFFSNNEALEAYENDPNFRKQVNAEKGYPEDARITARLASDPSNSKQSRKDGIQPILASIMANLGVQAHDRLYNKLTSKKVVNAIVETPFFFSEIFEIATHLKTQHYSPSEAKEALSFYIGMIHNPNKIDKNGFTPLTIAAAKGDLNFLQGVIGIGADLNKVDNNGLTPLLSALNQSQYETLEALLEAGANPSIKGAPIPGSPQKFSPLEIATILGDERAIAMIEASLTPPAESLEGTIYQNIIGEEGLGVPARAAL